MEKTHSLLDSGISYFRLMETIGLLSLLLALGTVVGLALAVFGVLNRKRNKLLLPVGAVVFMLAFGGLLFLLSRYGTENTDSVQTIQKRLVTSYQYTWTDTLGVSETQNMLKYVPSPLFINGDTSFVAYQEAQGILARGTFLENGDFRFEEESKQTYSPLQGTFQLTFQAGSTLEFERKSGPYRNGHTAYETITMKLVNHMVTDTLKELEEKGW